MTLADDYLDLDGLLTDDERAWRDTVRAFVRERITPYAADWYERAHFPRELVKDMGALGLLGMHLHGHGCAGRSAVEYGLAAMELEAGDSGIRTFVSVQGSLAMSAVHRFGSEQQKQRWLPGMAAGELIGCFGLTEPGAGSDPASMTTTATRDGDGWVIDGAKRWIGLASIADVAVVWARTDDGIRGFLVPTATPGFAATPIEPKLSMRASIQCDVTLDGVRVPADAVLPGATGLKGPFSCLNEARYGIMWGAMGAARDSYECALAHASSRTQFGRPVAGFQLTQRKLVDMVLEIQKGVLVALRTGRLKDAGRLRPEQISFGKLNNVREAIAICREARTVLGGNGIAAEHAPLRHANNLESVRTYEGTDEVHTLIMGKAVTGIGGVRVIDYYLLDEQLTDSAREVRGRVRTFVDRDVLPVINDYWDRAEFPFELVPKLADLRVAGTTISGYGCPGLSRLEAGMVTLELSRGDGSVNTFFGVQSGLAMGTIALLGSEEQKQRWLPGMAALELFGAFALTEPEHGSDSIALETTVRRDGDHWVLDGAKRWIGNASIADVVVVWARDVDDGQVTAIVVERGSDGTMPDGYETELITGKIGKRAVWQPDVTLRGVRVPLENRLDGARSFRDASRVLTSTRGGAAWESLGHAVAAFEIARDYALERVQFGRPIASFQLVQHKLADMLAEITSMQLYCFRMAQLQEQGRWTGAMASLAKMHHARKARQVCLDARDILGGNGLLVDRHVARHLTDMEVVHTYEGTDSIQSLIVGRDLTGISAFA